MEKLRNQSLGLFLVRLALAGVFIVHGVSKLANLEGTVGFFGMLGLPAFVAYLVAAVETLGGIAMLLGVWTEIAGVAIAVVMAGAILFAKILPLFDNSGLAILPINLGTIFGNFVGGWEFDLTLLLAALGIAFAGPGGWAIHGRKTAAVAAAPGGIPPPKQIA